MFIMFAHIPTVAVLGGCSIALGLLYFIVQGLLSPLRNVPGPAWTRYTRFWLFYREMSGAVTDDLMELHRKYGPILRIAPNEVSINDPEVYLNILYTQGTKFYKESVFYTAFANGPPNIFSGTDAGFHSQRRRIMSSAFSDKSVRLHESTVCQKLEKLCQIIIHESKAGAPTSLPNAFRSLTLDVITEFMYGQALGALDDPELDYPLLEAMEKTAAVPTFFAQFPLLKAPFNKTVTKLPIKTAKAVKSLLSAIVLCIGRIQNDPEGKDGKPVVLSLMTEQARIQNINLTREILISEGFSNVFAGTDTTAACLSITIWNIFKNPSIYSKLHEELRTLLPEKSSPIDHSGLKKLEYLNACVKEGLRVSAPVHGRLPRVVPPQGWTYKSQHFHAGTIVSTSTQFLHKDPVLFPDPETFDPERWLVGDKEILQKREKYLVPFSKGSRQCIGQNLAWMELRIAVAGISRRFRGEVVDKVLDTTECFTLVVNKPFRVKFQEAED